MPNELSNPTLEASIRQFEAETAIPAESPFQRGQPAACISTQDCQSIRRPCRWRPASIGSLERTLKTGVACTIVSAGLQVVQAAKEGVPIFSKYPRDCEIFQNLAGVVERVVGRPISKTQASADKSNQRGQRSLLTSLRERWTQ